jgi:hypothetical protein
MAAPIAHSTFEKPIVSEENSSAEDWIKEMTATPPTNTLPEGFETYVQAKNHREYKIELRGENLARWKGHLDQLPPSARAALPVPIGNS